MYSQFNDLDLKYMRLALDLAGQGRYSTSPNPRVGCVIARGEQIVGQGFHVKAGEPHAEVHALRQAGAWAKGATAYVTLEPCSHYGRTPPCAENLIQSGVSRVVAAMTDPNPLVAGKGLAMLAAAGIQVEQGLLEQEACELNRGFLSRIERNRPFVKMKIAASLDNKTALSDGQSQWITGNEARSDVQKLRAASCAILTGIGTVLADNPLLNVRELETLRQPIRIVLDSQLRTPTNSRLIQDGQETWLMTLVDNQQDFRDYENVHVFQVAERNQQIDLEILLHNLAQKGVGELMIEAGATLNSAFLRGDWVDELIVYLSPKLLGEKGQFAFRLPENPDILLRDADWRTVSVEILGNDIKWVLRKNIF